MSVPRVPRLSRKPALRKLAWIGNPRAGAGRADRHFSAARKTLWGRSIDQYCPESAAELTDLCRDLSPEVYEAAIVCGGDGTQNLAIRGLVESKVPLYPFPGGTANDLARELKLDGSWSLAQRLLDETRREAIDLVEVQGVPFATIAGIGLGAVLAEEFNRRRKESALIRMAATRLRSSIYTWLAVKTLMSCRKSAYDLRVVAGSFDERVRTAALFVCNQGALGGDLEVAPTATNDDQRFRVVIIPHSQALSLAHALASIKMGKLPDDFISLSTDRVTIKDIRGKSIQVFGDGEILAESPTLEFKIRPRALMVYRNGAGQ